MFASTPPYYQYPSHLPEYTAPPSYSYDDQQYHPNRQVVTDIKPDLRAAHLHGNDIDTEDTLAYPFPSLSSQHPQSAIGPPSSSRTPYTPTFPSFPYPTALQGPSYGEVPYPLQPIIVEPEAEQISPSSHPYNDTIWQQEYEAKPILIPTPPMLRPPAESQPPISMTDMPKVKVDMNMAPEGSVAATPGIRTPLATYAGKSTSAPYTRISFYWKFQRARTGADVSSNGCLAMVWQLPTSNAYRPFLTSAHILSDSHRRPFRYRRSSESTTGSAFPRIRRFRHSRIAGHYGLPQRHACRSAIHPQAEITPTCIWSARERAATFCGQSDVGEQVFG
jgi:hypothetical protein